MLGSRSVGMGLCGRNEEERIRKVFEGKGRVFFYAAHSE